MEEPNNYDDALSLHVLREGRGRSTNRTDARDGAQRAVFTSEGEGLREGARVENKAR